MRIVTSRSSPPFSSCSLPATSCSTRLGESRRWNCARVWVSVSMFLASRAFWIATAACAAMPVKICRSFSVNALVAICESMCMMPSSSSPCSSGTHMVERMPCMMIECAPEKRESMVASDDEHGLLVLLDLGDDRLGEDDLLVVLARSCA